MDEHPNHHSHHHLGDEHRVMLAQERTRLASERTFLSWLRTGLTGVGIGVVVAKLPLFYQHQSLAKIIGSLLILWGIVIFVFALASYWSSYERLEIKVYKSSLLGVSVLTIGLVILCMSMFWIVT